MRAARERSLTRGELRRLWKAGVLAWMLDANQLVAYHRIQAALAKPWGTYTLLWARRTGKTFVLELVAMELCLRRRGARVNVAAATKESLAEYVWPTIYTLLETCPDDLRPWVREDKGRVIYHRHLKRHEWSITRLAGCNTRRDVERLRGPRADLNIVEEAGAMTEDPGLAYVEGSILKPQTLTTKGALLRAGTPPDSLDHEFVKHVRIAEASGEGEAVLSHRTLHDNPRLTEEDKLAYLESDARDAGMTVEEYRESTTYQREWMARIVTDPTKAVIPNFSAAQGERCRCEGWHDPRACASLCWDPPALPTFCDWYEALDIGFSPDRTAWLLAYWHFERQELVIVREREWRQAGRSEIAHGVREEEVEGGLCRWETDAELADAEKAGRTKGQRRVVYVRQPSGQEGPFLRVADNNNPILLRDLQVDEGLSFTPTSKDELHAMVSEVRAWVGMRRLVVTSGAPRLRAQLLSAVWAANGKEFARSKEHGHFDLLAALVYLVRNVLPNINRTPAHLGRNLDNVHVVRDESPGRTRGLEALFG